MKHIMIGLIAALSLSASAHTIEGTQILKGAIKTKIIVNNVKTTCKAKVDKIKNLMLEDSFGNPAYNIRMEISLDGTDYNTSQSVKFDQESWFNNLFTVANGTEVRDLEYASPEGSTMKIDREGRIKSVSFAFRSQEITCSF